MDPGWPHIQRFSNSSLKVEASTTETGCVAGCVVLRFCGDIIDCSKRGASGVFIPPPSMLGEIEILSSEAEFILLVDNNSAYTVLAEERFYLKEKCVIISSNGHNGPKPTDLNIIPKTSRDLMTDEDIMLAKAMMKEDNYLKDEWASEMHCMVNQNQKAVLDSLCALDLPYISNIYLLGKLKDLQKKDYL